MKHIGNLEITKANQNNFKELVEVTGNVSIYSSCELPKLQTVGGYVYINSSCELPKLQTVGGHVSIYSSCELPKLQTVGGYVHINSSCEFKAPKLQTVGGYVHINSSCEFKAPLLKEKDLPKHRQDDLKRLARKEIADDFERQGYVFADGILQRKVSKKKAGNIIVYKVKSLTSDTLSYVIFDGINYSHGDTLEKAKSDLKYKIASRDTSIFKKWQVTEKKSIDEMIMAYRAITGACELGTKHFCESQALKEKYTLKEVFELTKGQFGNDKFREFFL